MTLLAESPVAVTATQVTDAVLDGAWVVDVRPTPVVEPAADGEPVGWLIPWEDDIVLLTGSPDVLDARSGPRWR